MPKFLPLNKKWLEGVRSWAEARYLHGGCFSFALAMQHLTGKATWVLKRKGDDTAIHAVVESPFREGYFDARGDIPCGRLGEPFGLADHQLDMEYLSKPIMDVDPEAQRGVWTAMKVISILWPELAKSADSPQMMTLAFVAELETLCRKHGFWVTGGTGGHVFLREGEGDENGYLVTPTADGLAYMIERELGKTE